MVAIPVMAGSIGISNERNDSREDVSERTQYMTTAKNILIAGGDAAERLMSSYKEV
jgi:ATP-binding cassette subfamily D (ALD) protein 2